MIVNKTKQKEGDEVGHWKSFLSTLRSVTSNQIKSNQYCHCPSLAVNYITQQETATAANFCSSTIYSSFLPSWTIGSTFDETWSNRITISRIYGQRTKALKNLMEGKQGPAWNSCSFNDFIINWQPKASTGNSSLVLNNDCWIDSVQIEGWREIKHVGSLVLSW